MTNEEKFNQVLNNCRNPRAVYAALLVLGNMGLLGKPRKEEQP